MYRESFSNRGRNSYISRTFLYKLYVPFIRTPIYSILFFSSFLIGIFIYWCPGFPSNQFLSQNIMMDIHYQKKFYCIRNKTSYRVDPKIITYIKTMFNGSLEQANSHILDELEHFQKGIDQESKDLIGYVINSILVILNCDKYKLVRNPIQKKIRNPIRKAMAEAKQKYKVGGYGPEVFWSHHGLHDESEKILDYVKNRDIVDIGAFCGDSLLILIQYTNKIVYSVEYSPANIQLIKETIYNNGLDQKHIKIIPMGISNEVKQITTEYEQSPLSRVKEGSDGDVINMTTLDIESVKYQMKVGFMKADIEGMELFALEGAVETIKRDRPIISFSIYHNYDGLFRIRRFIDKFPNYTCKYKLGSWNSGSFGELIIFAYPSELK